MTNAYVAFVDEEFTRTYSVDELVEVATKGSIPIGTLVCYLVDREWYRYTGTEHFWMDIPREVIPPELQLQALLFT